MTANWKARWEEQRLSLVAARREASGLRLALDELNSDLESILNDDAQVGHEQAKSHAIRAQMATIRSMRQQIQAMKTEGKDHP